jgi:LysR family transcriptional regulator, low CO2-responsive transcriptional regulator
MKPAPADENSFFAPAAVNRTQEELDAIILPYFTKRMNCIRRNILDFLLGPRENSDLGPRRLSMTLWQLKTFATVAREGSFTKAGKVLQISQPSVSSLVIGLQKELGVKLFEKLGVKPHLTEAGRRLLNLAENALATVDRIPEEMEEVRGLKKGRLRVGGGILAAATFLPLATEAFKRTHPGIEVFLKIERSESLEKMLLDGDIDIAITTLLLHSQRLISEPFREEKVVVIAPPNHHLARKRSVPLRLLANEPLIIHEKGTVIRDKVERKFAERGVPFVPALQVGQERAGRDAIRTAVASGLGIGFLSHCFVSSDLKAGRVKELSVPELKLSQTLHLNVPKRRDKASPLLQSFIEFLKQNYREKH